MSEISENHVISCLALQICFCPTVMGKKKYTPATFDIFRNILRRHEIFYDRVNIVDKFFYQNYDAHVLPWRSLLAYKGKICTFENVPNPGGHLEICEIYFGGVWPPFLVQIRYQFYIPRFLTIKSF